MSVFLSAREAVRAVVLTVALAIWAVPGYAGTPQNDQPLQKPAAAAEPFAMTASVISNGGLLGKWESVSRAIEADIETIRRCRSDRANCTSPAALRLIAIIDSARDRDGLAKLGEVNRAINLAIRPMSDEAQHGLPDFWSSPLATLTSGVGDCEDYAIAKYVALQEAGVSQADLRLVIVHDRAFGEDHAVLAVRFEDRWRMLDNRRMIMAEDNQMRHLQPLFTIDREGVRRFEDPNMMIAVASSEQPMQAPTASSTNVEPVTAEPTEIASAEITVAAQQPLASDGFAFMMF